MPNLRVGDPRITSRTQRARDWGRLDADVESAIRSMRAAGATWGAIAERTGWDERTVRIWGAGMGLAAGHIPTHAPEKVARVVALRAEGASWRQIKRATGVPMATAYGMIQRAAAL